MLAERLDGEDRLLEVIARRRALRLVLARDARDDLDRLVRRNERSALIERVPERSRELRHVSRVHRQVELPSGARLRDPVAREDVALARQRHLHVRPVGRRGDGRIAPHDVREASRPVGRRPAPGAADPVVARHRGGREEQRRVVRERVAADSDAVAGIALRRARAVARARAPVLAGGAALAQVFERVELVDRDRHRAHEMVRAARDERRRREGRRLAAAVGVRPLQLGDPGQVDLHEGVRRDRLRLAHRTGPRDRDVRGLRAGVRDNDRVVEDRPRVVRHDGRPEVAPHVRLPLGRLVARRRVVVGRDGGGREHPSASAGVVPAAGVGRVERAPARVLVVRVAEHGWRIRPSPTRDEPHHTCEEPAPDETTHLRIVPRRSDVDRKSTGENPIPAAFPVDSPACTAPWTTPT